MIHGIYEMLKLVLAWALMLVAMAALLWAITHPIGAVLFAIVLALYFLGLVLWMVQGAWPDIRGMFDSLRSSRLGRLEIASAGASVLIVWFLGACAFAVLEVRLELAPDWCAQSHWTEDPPTYVEERTGQLGRRYKKCTRFSNGFEACKYHMSGNDNVPLTRLGIYSVLLFVASVLSFAMSALRDRLLKSLPPDQLVQLVGAGDRLAALLDTRDREVELVESLDTGTKYRPEGKPLLHALRAALQEGVFVGVLALLLGRMIPQTLVDEILPKPLLEARDAVAKQRTAYCRDNGDEFPLDVF